MALERSSNYEIPSNELPHDLDLLKLWSDSGSSWSLLEREAYFQMRCQHLQQEESRWHNRTILLGACVTLVLLGIAIWIQAATISTVVEEVSKNTVNQLISGER